MSGKAAIKREQSQACLNSVEREQVRQSQLAFTSRQYKPCNIGAISTTNCVKDVFSVFFLKPCAQAITPFFNNPRLLRNKAGLFHNKDGLLRNGVSARSERRIKGHDTAYRENGRFFELETKTIKTLFESFSTLCLCPAIVMNLVVSKLPPSFCRHQDLS